MQEIGSWFLTVLERFGGVYGGVAALIAIVYGLYHAMQKLIPTIAELKQEDWFSDYRQLRSRHNLAVLSYYVPLSVGLPRSRPTEPPKRYLGLKELMNEIPGTILLLGDPGSGKTTILNALERQLLEEFQSFEQSIFPILVNLNTYTEIESKLSSSEGNKLLRWLELYWKDISPNTEHIPELSELFEKQNIYLLLDGLNEMAYFSDDAQRRFSDLAELIQSLPSNVRVVVSCRTQDVQGELFASRATVEPMSFENIQMYLKKIAQNQVLSETGIKRIEENLIATNSLELYQNPYRLSLLVQVVDEDGAIPQNSAELMAWNLRESIKRESHKKDTWMRIRRLFSEEDMRWLHRRNSIPPATAPSQGELLPAIGLIAFRMQEKGPSTVMPIFEIERLLPQNGRKIIEAAETLDILRENIINNTPYWRFVHQQYQEFFAARAWLVEVPRTYDRAFRPYLSNDPAHKYSLNELITRLKPEQKLPQRNSSGWEETATMALELSGEDQTFVNSLMAVDPIQAAHWAFGPYSKATTETKSRLRKILADWCTDLNVDVRARIDAGSALDTPEVLDFEKLIGPEGHDYLLPPLIEVPQGVYQIGSDQTGFDQTASEFRHEGPQHQWTLGYSLKLAKYPVTIAEFELFCAAGGYDDMRWWPLGSERRAWREGKIVDEATRAQAERIRQLPKQYLEARSWGKSWTKLRSFENIEDGVKFWESLYAAWELRSWSESFFQQQALKRQWDNNQVKELNQIRLIENSSDAALAVFEAGFTDLLHPGLLGRPTLWERPSYFYNSAIRTPLQPISGICRFEAEAYISWLSFNAGKPFRLPSEQEWEAAARGFEGRTWAYGHQFSPLSCNTDESGQRTTTPIGVYPDGETPEGIQDLSGNVWELTSSNWQDSYASGSTTNQKRKVLRGGSCTYPMNYARVTSRYCGSKLSTGFRLSISDS